MNGGFKRDAEQTSNHIHLCFSRAFQILVRRRAVFPVPDFFDPFCQIHGNFLPFLDKWMLEHASRSRSILWILDKAR